MDNYVGKRLDGRYIIKEIIGVGGMAVVYKAYDSQDDRVVAIKILKDEYLTNDDFRRRFQNESKAIAVLSHPNIVKVYDVSYGDRMQYIVMEYVEGITLKEYIGQQGCINWKETLYFVTQILRALQHAHDKGIIHRDIKPQNILLLENGTIKVTDFGIARLGKGETQTMSGSAVGSVHYISPEQARGGETDNKSDVYSVGVVLYEMMTGKLPFESETAVSVALMQLQKEAVRPREIDPSIPVGIEQIIIRAMQKNPGKRYQSASEMLVDIDAVKRNPQIQFNHGHAASASSAGCFVDDQPTRFVQKTPAPVQRRPSQPARVQEQPEYVKRAERPRTQPVRTEEDEYEEETNHTLPIIGGIIGGMFVLVAIIIGICLVMGVFSEKVEVPDFIGLNYYEEILNNEEYLAAANDFIETGDIALYMERIEEISKSDPAMAKAQTQITLLSDVFSYINLAALALFGMFSMKIYKSHAKKKLGRFKARPTPAELSLSGGTSGGALAIGIVLFAMLSLTIVVAFSLYLISTLIMVVQ